jgi:predicted phage terminase large subunit-like protein
MHNPSPRQLLDAAAYNHLSFFAEIMFPLFAPGETFRPNWHIDAITEHLLALYEGDISRLLICMPPRSMKSYIISVIFPLWVMGRQPNTKILTASYNQPLSETFSRQVRQLIHHESYRRIFPQLKLDAAKQSAAEITTTARGFRLATSVGGTVTGRGCDYLIVDDPMKAEDADSEAERKTARDWFNQTAMTRFNDPEQGRAIVVAQRLHQDDVPGMLIETGGWTLLELPMVEWKPRAVSYGSSTKEREPGQLLQPERLGKPQIDRMRRQMGERTFEAQYNQRPLPPGGAIFKGEWLSYYDERPTLKAFDWIVQSWDTAYGTEETNDFSAATIWGRYKGKLYLLYAGRRRMVFADLEKKVREMRKNWNADLVIVEKQGAGFSLWQNVAGSASGHWLRTMSPRKSKEERAYRHTPKFERGEILFPRTAKWLDLYRDELLAFPHGRNDDMVDATTQFLDAVDLGPKFDGEINLARSYQD